MIRIARATTLGDLLARAANRWPNKEWLALEDRTQTFSEVWNEASHLAAGLIGAGVKPKEFVGILMSNSPEFVSALFGTVLAGAVPVLINTRLRARELSHVVTDSEMRYIIMRESSTEYLDYQTLVDSVADTASTRPRAIILGTRSATASDAIWLEDLRDYAEKQEATTVVERRANVSIRDSALMLYTSGTTSTPKGVLLSHEAITRKAFAFCDSLTRITEDDVCLAPTPLFHVGAQVSLFMSLASGATFVSMNHFDAATAARIIVERQVTLAFPFFPAILEPMIESISSGASTPHALRQVVYCSPPPRMQAAAEALPGVAVVNAFGSTETAGYYAQGTAELDSELRVSGQCTPLPGMQTGVVEDLSGAVQAVGEGELVVRGYGLFNGYHNEGSVVDEEGWFHTGDRGRVTPSGEIIFLGRIKDMLKVGGENVAAMEIESRLLEHPSVAIAQVVGIYDERLDEVPVAFIELKSGVRTSPAELIDFCKGELASFKVPRDIHFLEPDDWPMSATKIQKSQLVEMAAAPSSVIATQERQES